jgi:hypothetical protein
VFDDIESVRDLDRLRPDLSGAIKAQFAEWKARRWAQLKEKPVQLGRKSALIPREQEDYVVSVTVMQERNTGAVFAYAIDVFDVTQQSDWVFKDGPRPNSRAKAVYAEDAAGFGAAVHSSTVAHELVNELYETLKRIEHSERSAMVYTFSSSEMEVLRCVLISTVLHEWDAQESPSAGQAHELYMTLFGDAQVIVLILPTLSGSVLASRSDTVVLDCCIVAAVRVQEVCIVRTGSPLVPPHYAVPRGAAGGWSVGD